MSSCAHCSACAPVSSTSWLCSAALKGSVADESWPEKVARLDVCRIHESWPSIRSWAKGQSKFRHEKEAYEGCKQTPAPDQAHDHGEEAQERGGSACRWLG